MITHALLTDMYQFTMMQGLFTQNKHRTRCVFDRFYRTNPFQGAYTVVAGLEQVIEYVKGLRFSEDDIIYLRQTGVFTEEFLDYLTHSALLAPSIGARRICGIPGGSVTSSRICQG